MATCPIRQECIYYTGAMQALPSDRESVRGRFCHSEFEQCARYRVYEAADQAVPEDLYPDMQEQADKMISQGETIRFTARRKTE